ncbi:MAG: tetratricopeptide repeat protein [Candidatus Obscuribacterales bacterium]|nr:tetratricopeptide repeat protein [Candidatus Obscuribacterales bacterium]
MNMNSRALMTDSSTVEKCNAFRVSYATSRLAIMRLLATTVALFGLNDTAVAYDNLWRQHTDKANDLQSSGQLEKAMKEFNFALDSAVAIKAEDDLVAQSYHNIARLYKRQHKYKEAEEFLRKALALREQSLRPDAEPLLRNLEDLCWTLYDERKLDSLKPLATRLISLREGQTNQDYENVERYISLMGRVCADRKQYLEAQEYLERAIEKRKKAYGSKGLPVADGYDAIARIKRDQHLYAESRSWYEKALAVRKTALGLEHLQTLRNMDEIASLYQREHRYEKAKAIYKEILATKERMFSDDKLELARAHNDLIRVCMDNFQTKEAIPLIEKELTLLKEAVGDNNLELAETYDRLSHAHEREHEFIKAIEDADNALEIRKKALGDKNIEVAHNLKRISRLHQQNGNHQLASLYLKREMSILKSLLGGEHPEYRREKEDETSLHSRLEKASKSHETRK